MEMTMLANIKGSGRSNPSTGIKLNDDIGGFSEIFERELYTQQDRLNSSKVSENLLGSRRSSNFNQQREAHSNNLFKERYETITPEGMQDKNTKDNNKLHAKREGNNVDQTKDVEKDIEKNELKEEQIENPAMQELIKILEKLKEVLQIEEESIEISTVENLMVQLQQLTELKEGIMDLEVLGDMLKAMENVEDSREIKLEKINILWEEMEEIVTTLEKEALIQPGDIVGGQGSTVIDVEENKEAVTSIKSDLTKEGANTSEKDLISQARSNDNDVMSTRTKDLVVNNDIKEETIGWIHDVKPKDVMFNNMLVYSKEINSSNILEQIVYKMDILYKSGKNQLSLQLTPENLGKLSIELISENNDIRAKVYVESLQVKEVIESNLNQLRDSMREKGMQIGSLEVSVGDQQEDFQQHEGHYTNKLKTRVWRERLDRGATGLETIETKIVHNPYILASSFDKLI